MKCSKCTTIERLTEHHQYPVCHFGHRRDGLKIVLCRECHRRIEERILAVESFIGNVTYGTRYKLDRSDYDRITRLFLRNQPIIYLQT